MPILMIDDPGKDSAASDLSLTSKVRLWLFRAAHTRGDGLQTTRKKVGQLFDPPKTADTIRHQPDGVECRMHLEVREELIAWALAHGRELPSGIGDVETASRTPIETSPKRADDNSSSRPSSDDVIEPFRYRPVTKAELEQEFFERDSTERFIQAFQSPEQVTIYAGAGVAADQGAPLGDALMNQLLTEHVKSHPFIPQARTKGEDQEKRQREEEALKTVTTERIVRAIRSAYAPGYIGSIVRHGAMGQPGRKRQQNPDSILIPQIRQAISAGQATGGFLARSIGALAFALLREKKTVLIITTNYDESLIEQRKRIEEYFEEFFKESGYDFEPRFLGSQEPSGENVRVPVIHINGMGPDDGKRVPDSPILGEAQFFDAGDADYQKWREAQMAEALARGECLFVGTSLTDPDVIRMLATTKGNGNRYVIALAPDREKLPDGSIRLPLQADRTSSNERAIARDVVAQRYLHLGVEPILVDHPYQVPQLLTELALQTVETNYESYTSRSLQWWNDKKKDFGYSGEVAGKRDRKVQEDSQEVLLELRNEMYKLLKLKPNEADERLKVEVWVRNPVAKQLFLWATSESLWLFGDSAHTCEIEGPESQYVAQETFREGHRAYAKLNLARGRFSYHLSVPLTLHLVPWYHLPVGIVSVLSSETEGALFEACGDEELLDALEAKLQSPVNDLLDPVPREDGVS